MTAKTVSTRRLFLGRAGAALSAPLAVGAAHAAAAGEDARALKARVRRLEDLAAIRRLHETYLACINARAHDEAARLFADPAAASVDAGVRSLAADGFNEHVDVAADRASARVQIRCRAVSETPIEGEGSLVEMARQQGEGFVRRSEARVLETVCVRRDGVWKLERAACRPV